MQIERTEAVGLGAAVGGHILLFGALMLGFLLQREKAEEPEPIQVTLQGEFGEVAGAPATGDDAPPAQDTGEGEPVPEPEPEAGSIPVPLSDPGPSAAERLEMQQAQDKAEVAQEAARARQEAAAKAQAEASRAEEQARRNKSDAAAQKRAEQARRDAQVKQAAADKAARERTARDAAAKAARAKAAADTARRQREAQAARERAAKDKAARDKAARDAAARAARDKAAREAAAKAARDKAAREKAAKEAAERKRRQAEFERSMGGVVGGGGGSGKPPAQIRQAASTKIAGEVAGLIKRCMPSASAQSSLVVSVQLSLNKSAQLTGSSITNIQGQNPQNQNQIPIVKQCVLNSLKQASPYALDPRDYEVWKSHKLSLKVNFK